MCKYINFFQTNDGWEEVFEFIFPEDERNKPNLKILSMAQKWAQMKAQKEAEEQQKTIDKSSLNKSTEVGLDEDN